MATYSPCFTSRCTSTRACVSTSSVTNTFLIPRMLISASAFGDSVSVPAALAGWIIVRSLMGDGWLT